MEKGRASASEEWFPSNELFCSLPLQRRSVPWLLQRLSLKMRGSLHAQQEMIMGLQRALLSWLSPLVGGEEAMIGFQYPFPGWLAMQRGAAAGSRLSLQECAAIPGVALTIRYFMEKARALGEGDKE